MEPFGLFHFLKTFLDLQSQNTAKNTEEFSNNAPEKEETFTEPPSPQQQELSPSVHAVLQFMESHEQRAKNRKKS